MGVEPIELSERNQELIKDYRGGMSFVDLVSKYRITSQRIYQIIKSVKKNDLEN
jgi:Mor family transcriptional regulator